MKKLEMVTKSPEKMLVYYIVLKGHKKFTLAIKFCSKKVKKVAKGCKKSQKVTKSPSKSHKRSQKVSKGNKKF